MMSHDYEPMVFDSPEPIEIPVVLGGKTYALKEAPEALYARYLNELSKASKVSEDANGVRSVVHETTFNTEALLVSFCLFEVNEIDGKKSYKTVDVNTVRAWTHRIVKPLFDKAEEINGSNKRRTADQLEKEIKKLQTELNKLKGESAKPDGELGNS